VAIKSWYFVGFIVYGPQTGESSESTILKSKMRMKQTIHQYPLGVSMPNYNKKLCLAQSTEREIASNFSIMAVVRWYVNDVEQAGRLSGDGRGHSGRWRVEPGCVGRRIGYQNQNNVESQAYQARVAVWVRQPSAYHCHGAANIKQSEARYN
jgi:hypothetical protein